MRYECNGSTPDFDSDSTGSNPVTAAKYKLCSQIDNTPLNDKLERQFDGSERRAIRVYAGIGRQNRLKICRSNACGFKSHYTYCKSD